MKTASNLSSQSIGEQLLAAELISRGQLNEAISVQQREGGTVVSILMSMNHLTPAKVDEFLSAHPNLPSIELHNYQVPKQMTDLLPREFAVKHQVFPIDKLGKSLTVGMVFPLDTETIAQIEQMTGLRVKAFLCHADDIQHAIQHYYVAPDMRVNPILKGAQIGAAARIENVADLIKRVDALPVLPETVRRVQEASQRADVALKEIADIVSQDPVISARLLKLANSPAFGVKHAVDSVELAVSLLGLKEISMAVVSSAVIDLTERAGNFDTVAFTKRSMLCAGAARRIAALCGFKKNPAVFTAGLLCDIGRFALAQSAPARYEKIPLALEDATTAHTEEMVFGLGHPEAGYMLAEHWELPHELSEPIRFHITPERAKEFPQQTAIVALAARVTECHLMNIREPAEIFTDYEDCLSLLGLTQEQLVTVLAEITIDAA